MSDHHAAIRAAFDRARAANPGPPEFRHGNLTAYELGKAAGAAARLATLETGELAAAWQQLADALTALAAQRCPTHHHHKQHL